MRDREINHQNLAERDLRRIESDFDRFSVARQTGAHHFVAGMFHVAAGISGDRGDYALGVIVDGFDAPEAAAGEHDFFLSLGRGEWFVGRGLREWEFRFSGFRTDGTHDAPTQKENDHYDCESFADIRAAHGDSERSGADGRDHVTLSSE